MGMAGSGRFYPTAKTGTGGELWFLSPVGSAQRWGATWMSSCGSHVSPHLRTHGCIKITRRVPVRYVTQFVCGFCT